MNKENTKKSCLVKKDVGHNKVSPIVHMLIICVIQGKTNTRRTRKIALHYAFIHTWKGFKQASVAIMYHKKGWNGLDNMNLLTYLLLRLSICTSWNSDTSTFVFAQMQAWKSVMYSRPCHLNKLFFKWPYIFFMNYIIFSIWESFPIFPDSF